MDLISLSKALGVVAIVMSAVMKFPQLMGIFRSKSALGVSLSSLTFELFCYTVGSLYGFRYGYPLTTYGELGLLVIQNLTLHVLIIRYENMMSSKIILATIGYIVFVSATATTLVPMEALQLLFSFNLPIVILSKLAQIRLLLAAGTAGDVSLMTWTIATTGCIIRIFTTIVQTQDLFILANYCVGTVLNSVIVALIIHLQRKDKKKTS